MRTWFPAALAVFAVLAGHAQSPADAAPPLMPGTLEVSVADPTGAIITDATVNVQAASYPDVAASVKADGKGIAAFSLTPGDYRVTVLAPAFSRRQFQAHLDPGIATRITARLQVGSDGSPLVIQLPPELPVEASLLTELIAEQSIPPMQIPPVRFRRSHFKTRR